MGGTVLADQMIAHEIGVKTLWDEESSDTYALRVCWHRFVEEIAEHSAVHRTRTVLIVDKLITLERPPRSQMRAPIRSRPKLGRSPNRGTLPRPETSGTCPRSGPLRPREQPRSCAS